MSSPALTVFQREWVTAFQQEESMLRPTVNSSGETEGGNIVWTVSSAAPRMAERGVDGKIPPVQRLDTQFSAPLRELTHKEIKTKFDIFTAGPSQRKAVIDAAKMTCEREADQFILETLNTTTNAISGTGVVGGTFTAVTYAGITLIGAQVLGAVKSVRGGLTWLWSPAAWAALHTMPEFYNSQIVGTAQLAGQIVEKRAWIFGTHMHMPDLPGFGTATVNGFCYHSDGVGHAYDSGGPTIRTGHDEEDQYDFTSVVLMHACRILQPGGVWKIGLNA